MFDFRSFLTEQFQKPQNVLYLFSSYGVETPSHAAVEKWFQRASVPGEYLPVMLCILEIERGEPLRLTRYWQGGSR